MLTQNSDLHIIKRKLRLNKGAKLSAVTDAGVEVEISTNALAQIGTQAAPTALTTAATITAAELRVGLLTFSGSGAATTAYTLPTATNFEASFSTPLKVNEYFEFTVVGIGTVLAETATITTNTGWTLVGSMLVASNSAGVTNSSATFRARRTAANTFSLYRV